MKRGQSIKLFAGLRDLEIVDSAGELCGIADDLELEGKAGGSLRIAAILVGPGAYGPRMPRVVAWAVRKLVGSGVVRIPWSAVEHVTSRITLNKSASELGLDAAERRLAPVLNKVPFA